MKTRAEVKQQTTDEIIHDLEMLRLYPGSFSVRETIWFQNLVDILCSRIVWEDTGEPLVECMENDI